MPDARAQLFWCLRVRIPDDVACGAAWAEVERVVRPVAVLEGRVSRASGVPIFCSLGLAAGRLEDTSRGSAGVVFHYLASLSVHNLPKPRREHSTLVPPLNGF